MKIETNETSRRGFLRMLGAAGAAAAMPSLPAAAAAAAGRRHDPALTLLFSDSHVNGSRDAGLPHYQAERLEKAVSRVLAMDPLPARAVFFGDMAYLWGMKEDYALAAKILKPLRDAGIGLTVGMGNHDRRSAFLESFPEFAKTTKIPGRIVSVVDAGDADIIMLDGLQGSDTRGRRDMGPGSGSLCKDQQDWLMAELPKWRRPVFVCSHWTSGDFTVGEKKMHKFLIDIPAVAGYIHGHDHFWKTYVRWESWKSPRILKSLCLPSTGHWGDIGWALMRTSSDKATVSLDIDDWYFPEPRPGLPGADFALWKKNLEEKRGLTCTFTLKS